MKRMDAKHNENTQVVLTPQVSKESKAQPAQNAQASAVAKDLPCCCPGCFSFDF